MGNALCPLSVAPRTLSGLDFPEGCGLRPYRSGKPLLYNYQEHINARIRYADPDADARTRKAEEMEHEDEEAEQALMRLLP